MVTYTNHSGEKKKKKTKKIQKRKYFSNSFTGIFKLGENKQTNKQKQLKQQKRNMMLSCYVKCWNLQMVD